MFVVKSIFIQINGQHCGLSNIALIEDIIELELRMS